MWAVPADSFGSLGGRLPFGVPHVVSASVVGRLAHLQRLRRFPNAQVLVGDRNTRSLGSQLVALGVALAMSGWWVSCRAATWSAPYPPHLLSRIPAVVLVARIDSLCRLNLHACFIQATAVELTRPSLLMASVADLWLHLPPVFAMLYEPQSPCVASPARCIVAILTVIDDLPRLMFLASMLTVRMLPLSAHVLGNPHRFPAHKQEGSCAQSESLLVCISDAVNTHEPVSTLPPK